MKEFKCNLSDKDHQKVQDILRGQGLKTNKELMKYLVDFWWMPHNDITGTNVMTVTSWLDIWMENIINNMPDIITAPALKEIMPKRKDPFEGHCLLIGGGPSIFDDGGEQLRYIAKHYTGKIICVDKTLKLALENGVVPDIVCSVDGEDTIATWFDYDIIREHSDRIKYILLVTTHNDTVKVITGTKYFLTPPIDNKILPNATWLISQLTGTNIMNTGYNVGCFGIILALHMHFKTIGLIGMEHAYPDGTKFCNTQKFDTLVLHSGGKILSGRILGTENDKPIEYEFPCKGCKNKPKECPREEYITEQNPEGTLCLHNIHGFFFTHKNKFFGTECLVDNSWQMMVDSMRTTINNAKIEPRKRGYELEVINCTPTGILHGGPIKQMHLKDYVEKYR